MKTKLFTFLLLLISSMNYAQDSDIITINSAGVGNTVEEGIESAIKSAVKNVFIWKVAADTKLFSDSLDLNYASTTNKIVKEFKDAYNNKEIKLNPELIVSISLLELKSFASRNNILLSSDYQGEELVTEKFSANGYTKSEAIDRNLKPHLINEFQNKVSTNAKPLQDSLNADFNKFSRQFYKNIEFYKENKYREGFSVYDGLITISISKLKSFALRNGCEDDIESSAKLYSDLYKQMREMAKNQDFVNLEILSKKIIEQQYGYSGIERRNLKLKQTALRYLLDLYNTEENISKNPEKGYNILKDFVIFLATEAPSYGKNEFIKVYDLLLKYKRKNSTILFLDCNDLIKKLNEKCLKQWEIPLDELDVQKKNITLTVSGKGNTVEDAQQKALRSAIEQAFGSFISSKTEILNDKLILDQITSLTNGNIQSFETLEKIELPDKQWAVTVKAIISVNKLMTFVESKGVEIDIKGDLFAKNIKMQMMNKKSEEISIYQMVGMLHENLQNAFDYLIQTNDPVSVNGDTNKWKILTWVYVNANKNMETCANYCAKTLNSIGMSKSEIEDYNKLKINYYQIKITSNSIENTIYLRSLTSIKLLESLANNITYYVKQYTISNGIKDVNGKGVFHERTKMLEFRQYSNNIFTGIKFFTRGEECALMYFEDVYSLNEIENNVKYKITALGIQSAFKEGGYVVYEKDGHGIVMCPFDIDMDRNSCNSITDLACGKKQCESLDLNGYSNWVLPSKIDMKKISSNLWEKLIGLSTPINSLNSKFMYFTKKDNLVKDEYCKIVKATQGMFNKESIKFYYSDENNFLDGIAKLRPIRVF